MASTTHVSSLTDNTSSLAVGDRVRILSSGSTWNGKIGRVVKFTQARVTTILESANPHLEPHGGFLAQNLQRMDDNENPSIAKELRKQFKWSQQKVRVKNPEHVLAEHVLVNYDARFLYNVVRVPTGMEHLSVYKTPALSHRNGLVPARDVWVPLDIWRQNRDQEADPEIEAINVPSEVRVANERGQSVSSGSTNYYSAFTSERPDHDNTTIDTNLETARNQSRIHTVTPPADQHPPDGTFRAGTTIDSAVLLAMRVIADYITANNGQINGTTLEQLFDHIQ
jgi:hypothetical protein